MEIYIEILLPDEVISGIHFKIIWGPDRCGLVGRHPTKQKVAGSIAGKAHAWAVGCGFCP